MKPAPLIIAAAGSVDDPLVELQELAQAQYLRAALAAHVAQLGLPWARL